MSELTFATLTLPAAELGPENPLPDLRPDTPAPPAVDPAMPEEDRRWIGHGWVPRILPYRFQDGYGRELHPRAFRAAVLENACLRATFLPELGGRLWSLFDKEDGRELLHANPVFQPGNLAIRNAWVAGGVEWNMGLFGHTPFTCAPLFTARLTAPDGTPVLRFYEWERVRRMAFQLDCWLPGDEPMLLVRVRLVNPHDGEVPMYWWSNIAVPEEPGRRVIVPAERLFRFDVASGLHLAPAPLVDGRDISYTTGQPDAGEYFFHLPELRRPWVASVDAGGRGLLQASTARLRGRKLFLWGSGHGGRNWQTFLSRPGEAYLEIQAGLARTQLECLPMPVGAEWSWLEAYGPLALDPARAHGDWDGARAAVEERLDAWLPADRLEARFDESRATAEQAPEEVVRCGSGWGALERLRRAAAGEPPGLPAGLPFPDASLGLEQGPWLELLEAGVFPKGDPGGDPGAWLVQPEWRRLLEEAVAAGAADHWRGWLHLGVMRYHDDDRPGARDAWERSLARAPSPWALRCLAVLARQDGQPGEAADLLQRALALAPGQPALAMECGQALLDAGRPQAWLDRLAALPAAVRASGRAAHLRACALLALGELDAAEAVLAGGLVLPDLREGELSLTDLWFRIQEARLAAAAGTPVDDALRRRARRDCPPPPHLDFRMTGEIDGP